MHSGKVSSATRILQSQILSSAFQRQADLCSASPFLLPSNLIVLTVQRNTFEQERLCCTLIKNINSEDWNKFLGLFGLVLLKVTITQISVTGWLNFQSVFSKRVVCVWATWAKLTPHTTCAERTSLTLQNLVSASCQTRVLMSLFGEQITQNYLSFPFLSSITQS